MKNSVCVAGGGPAGFVAAAAAARSGTPVQRLDFAAIRRSLEERGAITKF